jgi:hypothetical protein
MDFTCKFPIFSTAFPHGFFSKCSHWIPFFSAGLLPPFFTYSINILQSSSQVLTLGPFHRQKKHLYDFDICQCREPTGWKEKKRFFIYKKWFPQLKKTVTHFLSAQPGEKWLGGRGGGTTRRRLLCKYEKVHRIRDSLGFDAPCSGYYGVFLHNKHKYTETRKDLVTWRLVQPPSSPSDSLAPKFQSSDTLTHERSAPARQSTHHRVV